MIEIVVFAKSGGPLTKQITLNQDGTLHSDGSACVMVAGTARRVRLDSLAALAQLIGGMASDEAIALGALRSDLPDDVQITTKDKLNGSASIPNLIARSTDFIAYRPGQPAFALIDIDTKGMPQQVRERIATSGGYGAALTAVLPALKNGGRVVRSSTSAGLYRTDTGERLRGSDGRHVYVQVRDGADIPRFQRALHDRCWLADLAWMIVSRAGQLLERSLVDFSVGSPERLVFEGAPVLIPPLAQDSAARVPRIEDGPPLDTRVACPDLTPVEKARLRELKAAERHRLIPELDRVRSRCVKDYADRTGCTPDTARRIVERQHAGVLLPDVMLYFDDQALGEVRVAQVLADPDRFVDETLADPLEGVEYGRCKAKVMQRADGSLWIHSFAHGRTVYELKYDAQTIQDILYACNPAEVVAKLVRLLLVADVAPDEEPRLCEIACAQGGVKIRQVNARIKAAREQKKKEQAEAERQRRAAERSDPRVQLAAPPGDAEWLPVMANINEVLCASTADEPPMRDVEGYLTVVQNRQHLGLHTLTADGANGQEAKGNRLPPPEQPLLTRLDEIRTAEFIEQHIEFVDPQNDQPVHLYSPFVRHFVRRNDNRLPVVTAVTTLPLILPNGTVLSGRGLNRRHSIVLRVPDEVDALLPSVDACTPATIAAAMQFLTDEWLADVATDYAGKCMLIALALTIIERAALDQRPAFFISAGQRSVGKTTTIQMISVAVLGRQAAAAAWSSSEEERRKALFSYLGEGVPLLVWDNIARGATISCPSIEKSLTSPTYQDRILGRSETRTVPATTIQVFTGNNVTPRGDLVSRSLQPRLNADRPDPENRPYIHPDPISWTLDNRRHVLTALYTLLLGNPRLRDPNPPPAETRFKSWFHLAGFPVEHAAQLHEQAALAGNVKQNSARPPSAINFRTIILSAEADEEHTGSLATVLEVILNKWPNGCQASDIAAFAGLADVAAIEFKAALEAASEKAIKVVTATTVTWRLKALRDGPVQLSHGVYVLRFLPNHQGGTWKVEKIN
jgi:hypothetical protein